MLPLPSLLRSRFFESQRLECLLMPLKFIQHPCMLSFSTSTGYGRVTCIHNIPCNFTQDST